MFTFGDAAWNDQFDFLQEIGQLELLISDFLFPVAATSSVLCLHGKIQVLAIDLDTYMHVSRRMRMKDDILGVAIRQMKTGGYKRLNFADIATELETSRTNLHHHFKNKEGMALAATQSYIEQYNNATAGIFRRHDGDIVSILQEYEQYLINFVLSDDSYGGCLCAQLVYESDAPVSLRELAFGAYRSDEDEFRGQIEKCQKSGVLRDADDASTVAFRILATIHGISHSALIESNKTKLISQIKGSLVSIIR